MCSFVTGKPLIMLRFPLIIKSTDWPTIIQIDKGNPNLSIHNYIVGVQKMISSHAPLRKTRKRELKFQSKPWITSGLQKSIMIKSKLFGKFIKSTNSVIKEKLYSDYKVIEISSSWWLKKKMEAQVDQHAQYSCRNCLLFYGIKEEKGEDTDSIIINTSRKRWI